ncbi:CvpA family protein [Winogradskyella arenosi]|uniref:Membrane protein required for colicin V production n=1 Tax=Winogradskyella arenosi TaxID=533325 RepID=A0A368ZJ17_9FLAO|nr:CvpA family protein [Winogradskyella arenosi]RCW93770.1 membrane protein required for colicin V production [Winogradskyella arenosi]
MSVIDIILAALLLFGFIRGLFKGFFVEVASLVALVLGVWGAIHFSGFASDFLQAKVDWNIKTINIVAFAITFVVIVLTISLAGKALTKLADFAALGIINKLAGAVFGALKIGLILSVLLGVFAKMNDTLPFMEKEDLDKSVLYSPIKSLAPLLFPTIIKKSEDDATETTEKEMTEETTEAS